MSTESLTTLQHPLLADYPVLFSQTVAWGDMDAFQHVNNVIYFRYFESARIAYGRVAGMMEWRDTLHIGPIVAGTSARYKRPVLFPDHLVVGVRVTRMGDDRFWQNYRIVSTQQNAITTEGEAEIVMFNYKTQRKVAIPEELILRITQLEKLPVERMVTP